jgi:hypothetical protein
MSTLCVSVFCISLHQAVLSLTSYVHFVFFGLLHQFTPSLSVFNEICPLCVFRSSAPGYSRPFCLQRDMSTLCVSVFCTRLQQAFLSLTRYVHFVCFGLLHQFTPSISVFNEICPLCVFRSSASVYTTPFCL